MSRVINKSIGKTQSSAKLNLQNIEIPSMPYLKADLYTLNSDRRKKKNLKIKINNISFSPYKENKYENYGSDLIKFLLNEREGLLNRVNELEKELLEAKFQISTFQETQSKIKNSSRNFPIKNSFNVNMFSSSKSKFLKNEEKSKNYYFNTIDLSNGDTPYKNTCTPSDKELHKLGVNIENFKDSIDVLNLRRKHNHITLTPHHNNSFKFFQFDNSDFTIRSSLNRESSRKLDKLSNESNTQSIDSNEKNVYMPNESAIKNSGNYQLNLSLLSIKNRTENLLNNLICRK